MTLPCFLFQAIWTNPYGNDAVGIVEVVFSPTRQGDQPESPNPSTPIPVDLVVFEMNPRAAGRFNRSPDTIRGARMSELVDEATLARMLEPYALALETGEAQHFEHHAPPLPMSQDDRGMYTLKLVGRDSYFKTTVTHIGSNRITGSPICCFFENNVTHFKKQEREMRAKNLELADALGKAEVASKAKDEFLGMISHVRLESHTWLL